jgi:hypothetical protein
MPTNTSRIREAIELYEVEAAYLEMIAATADDDAFDASVDATIAAMLAVVRTPVTCADDKALLWTFMLSATFGGEAVLMYVPKTRLRQLLH